MQSTIKDFCQAVDLRQSRVVNGPQKITLFGGKTKNPDGSTLSQRGTFLLSSPALSLPADSFIVPEHYKNWNHFGTYDDLLSFEEDVCSLVDSVIVFLETEGAIAELGCLIKHEDIAPKLFVVVSNEYYQQDSFIKLGPLLYLENIYSSNIHVSHGATLSKEECEFIIEAVQQRFNARPKTEAFRLNSIRHVLFLIVDFVDLLQVARISDIQSLLQHFGIAYPKKRLEQLLLALKNVGLIKEERVLQERCFVLGETERPGIEYHFTASTAKRLSWKAKAFQKTIDDRWRTYAFRSLKETKQESESEKRNVA